MDKQHADTTPTRPAIDSGREPDATEKLRELVKIYKSRIERSGVAATREYRRAYAKGSPVVFATRMNDRTNGFAYKDELRPIYRHLVASVGAILNGVPFDQLNRVCGLSNEELRTLADLDRGGYGLFYHGTCGERQRRESGSQSKPGRKVCPRDPSGL